MLKRPERGYTIIETLIFLAVSGIMLGAAIVLVQGWQAKVQFDQSMRDLNSKVEQYVEDVGSGFFPGSNNYSCKADGPQGRPALHPPTGGGLGSNQDCIFLGKAIGAQPDTGQLVIYTVLGDRVYPSGPYAGETITSFDNALPEPEDPQLTQTYQILWGATIKSSTIYLSDGSSKSSSLVGFYNDLQNTTQAGAPYVLPKGYDTTNLSDFQTCIEQQPGSCGSGNFRITRWDLCLASNGSGRNALLTVSPSGLGVATKINIGGC